MTLVEPPTCEPPDRHPEQPALAVPAAAVDCHAHVFEPDGPTQLDPNRVYSPSLATLAQYDELHRVLGVSHGVIVQPSIYGTDNRTTLSAVEASAGRLRAVVVVDEDVSKQQLAEFHRAGARGVRVNMLFASSARLQNVRQLAKTIRSLDQGWHLQILTDVSAHVGLYELVDSLDVPVVFDHFGHMPKNTGIQHSGFQAMLKLLSEGQCWVKLSAAYRITAKPQLPFTDVDALAQAMLAANPEHLVWGTDWPHPQFDGNMPNDGTLMDELARWVPDQNARNRILVDNAHALYDF